MRRSTAGLGRVIKARFGSCNGLGWVVSQPGLGRQPRPHPPLALAPLLRLVLLQHEGGLRRRGGECAEGDDLLDGEDRLLELLEAHL
eukprot:1838616-Prymnesium_polylepis.2